MKKHLLIAAIFMATAVFVGFHPAFDARVDAKPVKTAAQNNPLHTPRIQMAILLDTSSSMNGLINQAREQLWQVVNEFSKSSRNGVTPKLEVAVYEYGNSGLAAKDGYVRQVSPLTSELDAVSEALFSLTTNGGDEFCGYVIKSAVNELAWSKNDDDIKVIFIAGNEPFTQGPVHYKEAVAAAKKQGITVNTIHAGNEAEGAQTGWRDGAVLAGGDFMNIDHNYKVVHVNAPQDRQLSDLNAKLNETYIPYGRKGKERVARQAMEDANASSISQGLAAKRTVSKASKLYDNRSWDLVDGMEKGEVTLENVAPGQLPEEMRKLDKEAQARYVAEKRKRRESLKKQITELSKQREEYVRKEREKQAQVKTVESAVTGFVRKEAEKKNFEFKSN
ncbi:MAG: VWA domain-containing protein [Gammaproteobacteria bacterium]|nr:VWA domain-containing protein [Gammaproteobacteria bacterium]MDH5650714.1 VWA domain-containing protein [Gammaproteobacteria bacterium]